MILTKSSPSWDTAMTQRLGDTVKVYANPDMFTEDGNILDNQTFKELQSRTTLVSFDWPETSQTVWREVSHWTPKVSTHQADDPVPKDSDFWTRAVITLEDDRMREFTRSTVENIGLDLFEVAKLVAQQCLERFNVFVLEVTLWSVKLGHRDARSAKKLKVRKRNEVAQVLGELLADTEYLYTDAFVEWAVDGVSITDSSWQNESSLAPDYPVSLMPALQDRPVQGGGFDLGVNIGEKELLVRVLRKIGWLQDSILALRQEVRDNHGKVVQQICDRDANIQSHKESLPPESSPPSDMGDKTPAKGDEETRVKGFPVAPDQHRLSGAQGDEEATRESSRFPERSPHSSAPYQQRERTNSNRTAHKSRVGNSVRDGGGKPSNSASPAMSRSSSSVTSTKPLARDPSSSAGQTTPSVPTVDQEASRKDESLGVPPKRGATQTPADRKKSEAQIQMKIECDSDAEASLLRESVEKAYLEDENPIKAKSFDTMLCLDTSNSMREGRAFEEMKQTVEKFIKGVEDTVVKSGVEENIGLVTFGGRAIVRQNLTNDFNRIRDQLDLMKPGGKSPFVEALLVAMAAFVKKGGIVSVSGEWLVKPRIIFFSDGKPTESVENSQDNDYPSNITNVRLSLSKMLMSFKNSENFNSVHPVVFVPVGQQADVNYMDAMAKICDGQFVKPEDVEDLCHYFRVQETIGKTLVCLRRETDQPQEPDKLEATITALNPDLGPKEKQAVVEVVRRELGNPSRPRSQRPRPTELDYVFEDTDKVDEGERLPLGTRVTRGPDWEWGNQDGGGPGTVINHTEKQSIHWVKWDNADYNCYPFSRRRGYHIWKTEEHPRLREHDAPLEIGMTVKKGPDWSSEASAEQGVGKGVIIRKSREKGKVMVRWSNGETQVCQWSPSGPKEVDYCDPGEDDSVTWSAATQSKAEQSASANGEDQFEGRGEWQYREVDKVWRSYDEVTNATLEDTCKKRNSRSCLVTRDGKRRRVLFKKMVETVVDEGMDCEVRRLVKT